MKPIPLSMVSSGRPWMNLRTRRKPEWLGRFLPLLNEYLWVFCKRRGGGVVQVPNDAGWAKERFGCDPAHGVTPEVAIEREWALRLIDHGLADVKSSTEASGQGALFGELRGRISCEPPPAAYDEIAMRLNLTVSAVESAAHRLRHRYREVLRRHIADTVPAEGEVEDEIRWIFADFGEPGQG